MRLKALKPHYFDQKYVQVGGIYITDIVKGKSLVKNGLCKEIKMPKRKK